MRRSLLVLAVVLVPGLLACATGGGRRHLRLPERTDELPFSNAVLAGDTLYVAGTLGIDPATGAIPPEVEREVRLALDGVRAALALADMGMEDLVSVQVFCTDPALYDTFNAIYRTYFPADPPARAFIGSGPLLRGARFEICGIATRR